jgi:hypothetical protein
MRQPHACEDGGCTCTRLVPTGEECSGSVLLIAREFAYLGVGLVMLKRNEGSHD